MSWRDDWDRDGDEAESEMEQARTADRGRAREPAPVAELLKATASDKLLTCTLCGFASSGHRCWRVHPFGDGLVCAGRHEQRAEGPPVNVDCFDRLDRELQSRRDRMVEDTRRVISGAKERGSLTDADRAFLRGIPGGQDSIEALEARFKREKEKRTTARRERGDDP